jgi:hypothetical protein
MSDRHSFPPYSLRMPVELREHLESAAKQNHRSLNAEIVARLEASTESAEQPKAVRGISKELLLKSLQADTDEAKAGGEQGLVELFARAMLLANEKLEADQKKPKRG